MENEIENHAENQSEESNTEDRELIRAIFRNRHQIAWLLDGTPRLPDNLPREAEQVIATLEAEWRRHDKTGLS